LIFRSKGFDVLETCRGFAGKWVQHKREPTSKKKQRVTGVLKSGQATGKKSRDVRREKGNRNFGGGRKNVSFGQWKKKSRGWGRRQKNGKLGTVTRRDRKPPPKSSKGLDVYHKRELEGCWKQKQCLCRKSKTSHT